MKKGDKVYFEFQEAIITAMGSTGNRITEVKSNGFIHICSNLNAYIFPDNPTIAHISNIFDTNYHKLKDIISLDLREIHDYFINLWVKAIYDSTKVISEMEKYTNDIITRNKKTNILSNGNA